MPTLPTSIKRIVVHVGTVYTTRRVSELTKRDFDFLFDVLKHSKLSFYLAPSQTVPLSVAVLTTSVGSSTCTPGSSLLAELITCALLTTLTCSGIDSLYF